MHRMFGGKGFLLCTFWRTPKMKNPSRHALYEYDTFRIKG